MNFFYMYIYLHFAEKRVSGTSGTHAADGARPSHTSPEGLGQGKTSLHTGLRFVAETPAEVSAAQRKLGP